MRTVEEITKELDKAYERKEILRARLGKAKVTSAYELTEKCRAINKEIDNLHRELVEATKKESNLALGSVSDSLTTQSQEVKRHIYYSGKKRLFQVFLEKWNRINDKADAFMLKYGILVAIVLSITIISLFVIIVKISPDGYDQAQDTTAETTISNEMYEAEQRMKENDTEAEVESLENETVGLGQITTEYIATSSFTVEDLDSLPIPEDYRIEVSQNDIDLMARVVMSEASKSSFECKIAIGETIVNRVLSDKYADTVSGVINQDSQYYTGNNGEPSDECYQAVYEALTEQKHPYNMFYFRKGSYHSWAHPYCLIDGTYFSLEEETTAR